MSETITTSKENILKAHSEANRKGKKLLEDLYPKLFIKDIKTQINSYKDACIYLGKECDESVSASEKIKTIIKAFNQGWVADYSNSDQYKYYPYWIYKVGSGFSLHCVGNELTTTTVGAPFVFEKREICQHVATHPEFVKLYNEMLTEK